MKPLLLLSLVFMPVAVGLQTLALVRDGAVALRGCREPF